MKNKFYRKRNKNYITKKLPKYQKVLKQFFNKIKNKSNNIDNELLKLQLTKQQNLFVIDKISDLFTDEMWLLISFYQNLSIEFIEKHIENLFMYAVYHSKNSDNLEFMFNENIKHYYKCHEYHYTLMWGAKNFSEEFIKNYFKEKDLSILVNCIRIPEKLIENNWELLNEKDKKIIYRRQVLSNTFYNKHRYEMDDDDLDSILYYHKIRL